MRQRDFDRIQKMYEGIVNDPQTLYSEVKELCLPLQSLAVALMIKWSSDQERKEVFEAATKYAAENLNQYKSVNKNVKPA